MTNSLCPWTSFKTAEFLNHEGYKIGRVIGEGSYCKVREAERYNRKMAVKIISRIKASSDFVNRFLPREISILQEINHPNIVEPYRILDFDEEVYIFMEIAVGGDLLEYIREHRYLSDSRARLYFTQLLSAIRYLHENQISHRDLKCENILIHGDGTIKLTDFGFSRKCVDSKTNNRVLSRTYCGSAAYAAPEIMQGNPYNPKMSDIWSLGVILFIMVTGRMPFDDNNVKKMVKQQLQRNIRYPSKFPDRISSDCKDLISRFLEPDVTRRIKIDQIDNHQWIKTTRDNRKNDAATSTKYVKNESTDSKSDSSQEYLTRTISKLYIST